MDGIRDYLLSVSCAALLCGVIGLITDEKSANSKLIKLLSGIFLATVIFQPLIRFDLSYLDKLELDITGMREEAVAEGERLALENIAQQAAISAQTMIEQEAGKLGCQLEISVLWQTDSPREVTLKGMVSPYAKSMLSQWIMENMGLPWEALIWIG